METFEGKVAVVTGAGSGIGQEVALQLLAVGARVTGVDINDRGLDPVRDAGGEAMVVDLADVGGLVHRRVLEERGSALPRPDRPE